MADYAQLNQAWDEWVDSQNPPSRATVEAKTLQILIGKLKS